MNLCTSQIHKSATKIAVDVTDLAINDGVFLYCGILGSAGLNHHPWVNTKDPTKGRWQMDVYH